MNNRDLSNIVPYYYSKPLNILYIPTPSTNESCITVGPLDNKPRGLMVLRPSRCYNTSKGE